MINKELFYKRKKGFSEIDLNSPKTNTLKNRILSPEITPVKHIQVATGPSINSKPERVYTSEHSNETTDPFQNDTFFYIKR